MNKYHKNSKGKKASKKDKVPEWQDRVCEVVAEEWSKGKSYCSDMNDLYEDIYKMFRGQRPDKKYDWQSDITLRKAFQVVWTTVTYALKKIYGGSPIIGVEGFNQKGCWQREMLLERWGDKDRAFMFHVMAWLRLALNGVCYVKKTWKQHLVPSQAGIPIPLADYPNNVVLNNKDCVVDWSLRPGQSCREGRFFIHQGVEDLGGLMASPVGYKNLDKINLESESGKTHHEEEHSQERSLDGQEQTPDSGFYRDVVVRERLGTFAVKPVKKENSDFAFEPVFDPEEIYKKDSDVEFRQMVAAIADPDGEAVLIRFEENPYGEINIIDGHMYLDPERWHSAGQIEPDKDLIGAMDDNINAMFDEIWRNLMPPAVFNKFAMVEWDTIQYAPGQKWMVGGDPNAAVMFPRPSNITSDAWMKHQMLDGESQLTTSITQSIQGSGRDKTATVGVLNAQYSSDKLDFLVMMYEQTVMVPDAVMSLRFAQMFGNPVTFIAILGEPFQFDKGWKDEYQFHPRASAVKLDQQKEKEIQEDIQLIQIVGSIPNPKTAQVVNVLLANIMRNRNEPKMAAMLDEDFYEPSSPAGNMQMLNRMLPPGAPSNQNGVPMSGQERSVRGGRMQPQRLLPR